MLATQHQSLITNSPPLLTRQTLSRSVSQSVKSGESGYLLPFRSFPCQRFTFPTLPLKKTSNALQPYLNCITPSIMANEMKAFADPEYMIRPLFCSGRIPKTAPKTSTLVENIKFQRHSMKALVIAPPRK